MATGRGFEPPNDGIKTRCVKPLHHPATYAQGTRRNTKPPSVAERIHCHDKYLSYERAMEQYTGFEPVTSAWKAEMLPLH